MSTSLDMACETIMRGSWARGLPACRAAASRSATSTGRRDADADADTALLELSQSSSRGGVGGNLAHGIHLLRDLPIFIQARDSDPAALPRVGMSTWLPCVAVIPSIPVARFVRARKAGSSWASWSRRHATSSTQWFHPAAAGVRSAGPNTGTSRVESYALSVERLRPRLRREYPPGYAL